MTYTTRVWTLTGAVIAALLYAGCVTWDVLVPAYAMNAAWAPLFPSFGLTGTGFLLGLLESLAYGALLGWLVVFVPATVARTAR